MNFYSLRILTFVFIIAILYVIYKFIIKKNNINLNKKILTVILVICYVLVSSFPFEKCIVTLNTVDRAFKYYFPDHFMRYKYESKDYAYVLFSDADSDHFMHFLKSDGRWGFDNFFNRGQGSLKVLEKYYIFINEIPEKEVTAIIVFQKLSSNEITITDSLQTKFDKIFDKNGNRISHGYIAIIEQILDENYTLNLNGTDYKIKE